MFKVFELLDELEAAGEGVVEPLIHCPQHLYDGQPKEIIIMN